MPVDVQSLLDKSEEDLHQYVTTIESDHLNDLFAQMWDSIKQRQLFGGQARSSGSTEALTFSQLALSVARHSNSEHLQAEAHRMMSYVLNANEQYEEAILHYMEAIILLERTGAQQKVARTRLGLISALFMTGRYEQALEEAE